MREECLGVKRQKQGELSHGALPPSELVQAQDWSLRGKEGIPGRILWHLGFQCCHTASLPSWHNNSSHPGTGLDWQVILLSRDVRLSPQTAAQWLDQTPS